MPTTLTLTQYLPPATTKPVKLSGPGADTEEERQKRLQGACRQFEGFLLGEMLKAMRDPEGQSGGLLPPSRAERVFIRQQCEALGEMMGQREPLGLARVISSKSQTYRGGGS